MFGEEAEDGAVEARVIGFDVGVDAVIVNAGGDAGIESGGEEGELSAHAESDDSHFFALGIGFGNEMTDGGFDDFGSVGDIEGHHE